ncbi:MAG: inosine/xanthosine triphosphatase [Thermoplasmata archaeon]
MRVAVGGTFNTIHKGHELLFETAFALGDFVEVGLTSDEFARSIKKVEVLPYPLRRSNLERYLKRFGKPFSVVMISDRYGTAAHSGEIDALVVSPETSPIAKEINEIRRQKGLPPLVVHTIREVKADDSRPISSSRILSGEIDKDGRLLRALKVAVGSTNQVKVDAVRNVFAQAFGLVEVVSVKPSDSSDKQPMEDGVVEGAIRRARFALEDAGADYGVGVEAGLFYNRFLGRYLDVQYCAVVDASGRLTVGHGPGFEYPPSVIDSVLKGRTVGDTMSDITGIEDIGHKQGSIGYLSDGMIDRTRLTEIAVLMALIPRIRRELYPE